MSLWFRFGNPSIGTGKQMFTKAGIFEFDWLLLLLFLLLLPLLLGQFNLSMLGKASLAHHLVILASIFVIVSLHLHFYTICSVRHWVHVGIKPLILHIIICWGVLHHAVDRGISRIASFIFSDILRNFFLNSLLFLVELRWLVFAYFTHKSRQARSSI